MAENKEPISTCETTKDDELEELLDSAISDFDQVAREEDRTDSKVTSPETPLTDESVPWDNEFLEEAQRQFEQNMKALFGQAGTSDGSSPVSSDEFNSQLHKLAEEANKVFTEHAKDPEFSATIAQTLRSLSEDAENIQAQVGPEALSAMFGGLGLGDGDGEGRSDISPLMYSIMQSLLSKEVFYPSLKEVTEKYPDWLKSHEKDVSEKEFQNYTKQLKIMKDVCVEFEGEAEGDSEEVKKERFTKILTLMIELEKLGQPPKDIVGEGLFPLEDMLGPNQLAGADPSQCCIM